MFWGYFTATGIAVAEILLLALIGYFLVKRDILSDDGLDTLGNLAIKVALPGLIFYKLIKNFNFDLYPNWWIFPLISISITLFGWLVARLFLRFIDGKEHKKQFIGLVMYQNSGYLPLAFISSLLPKENADIMFIYLFLFLLGFNLVIWSFGAHMLTSQENKKFEYKNLFNPPVTAILLSLFLVSVKLNGLIPELVLKPLKMLGDCTVPLVMLIVGGSLARIKSKCVNKKTMGLLILAKLIILPFAGLYSAVKFNLPYLIGLLVIIELSVPSATNLSVIIRYYKKEDLIVNQGILFTHIASIITLPLFLSLYFIFAPSK